VTLGELLDRVAAIVPLDGATVVGGDARSRAVTAVAYDSRTVRPGAVFFALRGHHLDGASYARQAADRGALAIVAESARPADVEVPWVTVANARLVLAAAASTFFDHPSHDLLVAGVTGTNGKTTCAYLLASIFGQPGDTPKVVLAPSTIEECFHMVVLARRLAEEFRTPVMVLTDANLATGVSAFPRPKIDAAWLAPEPDRSAWPEGVAPYDWDAETGLSARPIPGQRGGEYVVTGLAHTRKAKVAYDPESNQEGCDMRSRKLAALGRTLVPPVPHGAASGDLLAVGWGSTEGAASACTACRVRRCARMRARATG